MIILQVLFVFAFFFSSSTIFSAEPLEASACAVPQHDALTKLSPQFKEDLREVKALCNMRASLNNILFIAHAGNAGYQAHIKTDLAIYEKATKILKFINFDSAGPLNTNELKLNQGWIDKLYRHISMQAQSRTDQERMERLVYNTKRKKGRNNPMRSSEEILLELPVFTQIKEILGRYASRHEIEITRLLVTNVDFTVVSIDGNKVMTELQKTAFSLYQLLTEKDFRKFSPPKAFIGLKNRVAFEKAHPRMSISAPPPKPETKIEDGTKTLEEGVRLLCVVQDFLQDDFIKTFLKERKLLVNVINAEELQHDNLSALSKNLKNFSKAVDQIDFRPSTLDKDIWNYLVGELRCIKLVKDLWLNTLSQRFPSEGKELEVLDGAPVEESAAVEEVSPSLALEEEANAAAAAVAHPLVDRQGTPLTPADETWQEQADLNVALTRSMEDLPAEGKELEISDGAPGEEDSGIRRLSPPLALEEEANAAATAALPAEEAEEKEGHARNKTKKKKKKNKRQGELHPWGSSEPSPAESGAARKKRLISMVRQLSQQPRQSIQFQEIERAVSQLGGTIKTNGQDSHYLMRLNHIDTGHLVLGATLKKKAKGNEYPWWINTAVDALERAVGLVTDDMSRVFEKIHHT